MKPGYKHPEGKSLVNMSYGEILEENGFDPVPLVDDFVAEIVKSKNTKPYTGHLGHIEARTAITDR